MRTFTPGKLKPHVFKSRVSHLWCAFNNFHVGEGKSIQAAWTAFDTQRPHLTDFLHPVILEILKPEGVTSTVHHTKDNDETDHNRPGIPDDCSPS